MLIDLTATYRAPYKSVVVNYMNDGTAEFVACGDVSDGEIDSMIAAGGADVPGFTCELS